MLDHLERHNWSGNSVSKCFVSTWDIIKHKNKDDEDDNNNNNNNDDNNTVHLQKPCLNLQLLRSRP